jgi:hypothetical protein
MDMKEALTHFDPAFGNGVWQARRLLEHGFVVLGSAYPAGVIESAKKTVIANLNLLRNTRPNHASGHLAGFHRQPSLEPLHALVSGHQAALRILREATGCNSIRSIGLSDITVNRSQPWHTDLLRGAFRHHLDPKTCWGPQGGGVYKVLLYLQPGRSLSVLPGAHRSPVSLRDDRECIPPDRSQAISIDVEAGDLVVMDIRLPHCGSSEEALADPRFGHTPKILVSTVLGADSHPLTRAMEIGNFDRLMQWESTHQDRPAPALVHPA